jgi:hypothetical protein
MTDLVEVLYLNAVRAGVAQNFRTMTMQEMWDWVKGQLPPEAVFTRALTEKLVFRMMYGKRII